MAYTTLPSERDTKLGELADRLTRSKKMLDDAINQLNTGLADLTSIDTDKHMAPWLADIEAAAVESPANPVFAYAKARKDILLSQRDGQLVQLQAIKTAVTAVLGG